MASEIALGKASLEAIEKVSKLLSDKGPRQGFGNAAVEADRCAEIHVFLRCVGKTASLAENQRLLLSKSATVAEARAAFERERGKKMRQSDVRDEDGFRFSEEMQKEPLWKFSNGCRLTLSFQDSWSAELSKDLKSMNPFTRG
jgi:hypothetical protein